MLLFIPLFITVLGFGGLGGSAAKEKKPYLQSYLYIIQYMLNDIIINLNIFLLQSLLKSATFFISPFPPSCSIENQETKIIHS